MPCARHAGKFSNGDDGGTGYEYVPVLRADSSTPDLLRLEWDNGQLVSVTRVDIYSPAATWRCGVVHPGRQPWPAGPRRRRERAFLIVWLVVFFGILLSWMIPAFWH